MVAPKSRQLELTAVFRRVSEGYIGFVQELPGANTQGATLAETRRNLREAIRLILQAKRALAGRNLNGRDIVEP
jgi:predicted RNase H-like HicB family nuclease